jgi:hypothetical protein
VPDEVSKELGDFFTYIWGDTPGHIYLATLNQGTDFKQYMLPWPDKKAGIVKHVLAQSASGKDVYYSPALYKEKTRPTKDNVLGSHVNWVDFDHNAPTDWSVVEKVPEPTLVLQSSVAECQHVYWRSESLITDIEKLEDTNRALAYKLNADTSGWDADQLLRPPFTENYGWRNAEDRKKWYKNKPLPVTILRLSEDTRYSIDNFVNIGSAEQEYLHKIKLGDLPSLADTLALGNWSEDFYKQFKMTKEEAAASSPHKRSGALMKLAYYGAESGFSDEQIYVILDDADKRWDKYVKRSHAGREKVLKDTIARARAKHGYADPEDITFAGIIASADKPSVVEPRLVYDYTSFMEHAVDYNWYVKDLIAQQGFGYVTGLQSVGKTQFGVQLGITLAAGFDKFLIWDIPEGSVRKVLFLSLEMGMGPLQHIFKSIVPLYTKYERDIARNFHIAPLGQLLPADLDVGRAFVENLLTEHKPDVLFIDSLSAFSSQELTDEKSSKRLINFITKIRNKYGVAVYIVHHSRKKVAEQRVQTDMSDMYGNQFLFTQMDFAIHMRNLGPPRLVVVDCFKNRLAEEWPSFNIKRTNNLQYELEDANVGTTRKHQPTEQDSSSRGKPATGGFLSL